VVSPAPERPTLAQSASTFVQIGREVLERFRPQMRQAIQEQLDILVSAEQRAEKPACCGRDMQHHDSPRRSWLTVAGSVMARCWRYRCKLCGAERYPLLESLGVEPGQASGLLARTLSLLGCVAPYPLAAELCQQILEVKTNAMAVWRAVQRPPDVAVATVDDCSLGTQVRSKRRSSRTRRGSRRRF
jgi:hypothetical protein